MAQQYMNDINQHINQYGLEDLNPQYVYNLAYAELNNKTDDLQNITRIINYFKYAAELGEINAYNALAVIYMNGHYNPQTGEWLI